MLEYTEYCHNYYGTPRTVVEERLASGHDVILEIDVKGAMQVKKAFPGAVMIFPAFYRQKGSKLRESIKLLL